MQARRDRWRKALPCLALLMAAGLGVYGCEVGPDFVAPPAPAVEGYTAEGTALPAAAPGEPTQQVEMGQAVAAAWWRLLRSPELDGVIREALAGNRSLAAAKATLLQAQEAVVAAGGARSPQLDAGASIGRQKYGAAFLGTPGGGPPFTAYSVGPTVRYNLDLFGGTRRRIEEAQAQAEAQGYQLDGAYLALTGNVVTQALQIAAVRAQIAAVAEILADDAKNLDLVRAAYRAGAVTQVDVLSAESQLANDRTLLPPLRQQLDLARHALAILVGRPPVAWSPPDFALDRLTLPEALPLSLPSALVRARPDIQAAQARLHAASAAIGVATANLYPRIDLSATLTQEALDPGHLFTAPATAWSLLAGVTQPLFHGGTLQAERRAAQDAYQAALATYQETVLQAFGQVADTLRALAHDGEALAAQRHALDAAEAALRLTRLSYQAGNTGVLQVLDAERLAQQARLGVVRAQAQRFLDTTQLFLAMGGAAIPSHTQTATANPAAER